MEKNDEEWKNKTLDRMNKTYYTLAHLEYSARHIAAACILLTKSKDVELLTDFQVKFKLENMSILSKINLSIDKDLKKVHFN